MTTIIGEVKLKHASVQLSDIFTINFIVKYMFLSLFPSGHHECAML